MSLEIKHHLTTLLTQALQQVAPNEPASLILLERPKQAEHGDYACNVAMQLARSLKRKNPAKFAADPELQKLLENSHNEKVLWFGEKRGDCHGPKQRD